MNPLPAASFAMRPLGAVVGAVARRRRRNARPSVRLSERVVSVGNIVAGGVGKTPMVAYLVRMLREDGRRVGVVTGAYGARPTRRRTSAGRAFRCDIVRGADLPADAVARVGDETVMLAAELGDVPVAGGRPKARAAEWLSTHETLDFIVVDDGFQHHALARDVNIVLLDAQAPFDNGRVLPAGRLRESPAALRGADAIVVTGDQRAPAEWVTCSDVLAPGVTVLTAEHVAVRGRDHPSGSAVALTDLAGLAALGVCGLGAPASFRRTLQQLGADADMMAYPDHHAYTSNDFRRIYERAGGRRILTTAKDATKWMGRAKFAYTVIDVELRVNDPDALLACATAASDIRGPL